MILALDELLKKAKTLRALLLKISECLPEEENGFDRLLLLICMGKGGFLSSTALPNRATMNLICQSSELFEEILPCIDQQFLYQCMDQGTKAEMMQCVNTIRHVNIAKTVRNEYYFKALTIMYQILYEVIAPKDNLWEEFIYRLAAHWNENYKKYINEAKKTL